MLLQLQAEFETNLAILNETRSHQDGVIEATNALLELTGPNEVELEIDVDRVQKDIYAILRWWTYDP